MNGASRKGKEEGKKQVAHKRDAEKKEHSHMRQKASAVVLLREYWKFVTLAVTLAALAGAVIGPRLWEILK